jgi:hypothetical protein
LENFFQKMGVFTKRLLKFLDHGGSRTVRKVVSNSARYRFNVVCARPTPRDNSAMFRIVPVLAASSENSLTARQRSGRLSNQFFKKLKDTCNSDFYFDLRRYPVLFVGELATIHRRAVSP